MSFDISALSSRFTVRRLTESDVPAMLALAETNPVYYRYHFPAPSSEDILSGNDAAERLYTRAGFQFVQAKPMFYEDTGWTEHKMFDLNL